MSDKKSLFYDPENRFLWVQDGDKRIPLYTLANLNHETTRLTDEGYLQVKDSLTGVWDTIKDPAGNIFSLKGKDGVDGKDGLDGTVDEERLQQMQDDLLEAALEYHLELSNDSDQIYVGDTESYEVSIYQQLSTSVTLYQGGVLCPIDGTRWKLVINTKELPGIVTVNDNEIITFTFPTGTKIPHDRFVYQISAILYDKNGNILKEVIKDFKVVRLAGNVDYDLAVTPGYIKMASNGYLTTSQVTVKIRKKEIGLNGNAQFIVPGQLPQHLQCYYRWNQDSKQSVPYDGIISLPTDNSKKSSDKITISLENSTTTIDEAHVEIVQDGSNGVSPGHIELSDDFNQLSAKDNLVEVTQRFPLEIQYYIGTEPQELSDHNIQFPSSSLYSVEKLQNKTTSCVSAEIVVYAGTRILPTQLKIPISIGEVTKHFTLTKTSNTTLYSIIATPGLVKAVQDTTQSQLTWMLSDSTVSIEIFERQIGQESTSSKKTNSLPYGYKLEWFVDGEEQGQVAYSNGKASISVPQPINGVLAGKITLRLYDQYQELVDFSEVAIQANGEKGEKGDPSVLIDLTNDQDQLHITPEGKVLSTEPLTTDIHVFKGTKQLETNEYTIDVDSKSDVYTASVEGSTVTVQFNSEASIDTTLSQYLIPIKVTRNEEQDTFTKNFRLVVRQDNESFDFKCSPSSLVLSKTNTLTPDHIEVVVSKTVYGAITTVEKGVDWTLSGYRLYYTVDDDSSEYDITPQFTSDGKYIGQVLSSEIKKNSTTDRPKAHFYLDDGNGVNVDHEVINSLQDGIDGTNAETYVIDFSNDSDQIYIDQNNNLYENQSVTTEVKMFDGTTVLVPDTGYRLDIQQDSSLDGVLSTFELTTSNSYRVTFNFAGVDSIPVGMNSVNFTINIKNPLGDEIILSKIYKVSVVKDSTDYDLIPSTTRVRIKQDGSLDIPYIYFTVKKKSLGSNNQQSGIIEDLASEDLVLKYTIGNSPSTASTILSEAHMSTTIPASVDTALPISAIIELYKGSELRDFVIIDYLKDGEKGEKGDKGDDGSSGVSATSITMTPIQNIVYLYGDTSLKTQQSVSFSVFATQGEQYKDVSNVSVSNLSGSFNPSSQIWTWHPQTKATFQSGVKTYTATITVDDNQYETPIQIEFKQGYYGYNLVASPNCIKRSSDGTVGDITFKVKQTITGGSIIEDLGYVSAYEAGSKNLSLFVDDSLVIDSQQDQDEDKQWVLSSDMIGDKSLIEVSLKEGSILVDVDFLTEVRDGAPGTLEGSALYIYDSEGARVGGISGNEAQPEFLWAGSAVATDAPVNFTKNGIGSKIGGFYVQDENTISVGAGDSANIVITRDKALQANTYRKIQSVAGTSNTVNYINGTSSSSFTISNWLTLSSTTSTETFSVLNGDQSGVTITVTSPKDTYMQQLQIKGIISIQKGTTSIVSKQFDVKTNISPSKNSSGNFVWSAVVPLPSLVSHNLTLGTYSIKISNITLARKTGTGWKPSNNSYSTFGQTGTSTAGGVNAMQESSWKISIGNKLTFGGNIPITNSTTAANIIIAQNGFQVKFGDLDFKIVGGDNPSIQITGLPTTKPSVSNTLWKNGNVLEIT